MAGATSAIGALGGQWGLVTPSRITEGITSRELSILLKEAAADAERLIERNLSRMGTLSGQVTQAQLSAAVKGIGPVSTQLWNGTGKVTRSGMDWAAVTAADQSLDLDLLLGMPGNNLLGMVDAIHFEAQQVVDDLISRRTTGFSLADKVYAHGRIGTKEVGRIVEKQMALQRSAREIAAAVRDHFHPNVPGGASYASMRLARTEINNAHHETTKRIAKQKPWVKAMKWHLSGSHPRPDACNEYAVHNEGLGPGEWVDPPSKPHPMCLCFLTHVTLDEDEFLQRLESGEYDNYMEEVGVTGDIAGSVAVVDDMGAKLLQGRIDGKSWDELTKEFGFGSPNSTRRAFKRETGILDLKTKGGDLRKLVDELKNGERKVIDKIVKDPLKKVPRVETPLKKTLAGRQPTPLSQENWRSNVWGKHRITGNEQLKKDIRAGQRMVDKVLDIPEMPQLTQYSELPASGNTLGTFNPGSHDIKVRSGMDSSPGTFLHEFGHYLDNQAFAIDKVPHFTYTSENPFRLLAKEGASQAMVELNNVIYNSYAHQWIISHVKGARLAYVSSERELFARAFNQYIATKSEAHLGFKYGSTTEVGVLKRRANSWNEFYAWGEKDFKPIEKAFDDFFRHIGWLRE